MVYRIAASKVTFPDGSVCTNHVVEIDASEALPAWQVCECAVRCHVMAHKPLVDETPRTLWWSGTLEIHEGFIMLLR